MIEKKNIFKNTLVTMTTPQHNYFFVRIIYVFLLIILGTMCNCIHLNDRILGLASPQLPLGLQVKI